MTRWSLLITTDELLTYSVTAYPLLPSQMSWPGAMHYSVLEYYAFYHRNLIRERRDCAVYAVTQYAVSSDLF